MEQFTNREGTLKAIAALAPSISSGLIITNNQGVILHASKMQKWLKVESTSLIGELITVPFPGVDIAALPEGANKLATPKGTFEQVSCNIFRINGDSNVIAFIFPFGGESLNVKDLENLAEKHTKKVRQAIARKVAASGGVIGFTVWILTQITPLGTALRGAVAAWRWESDNPGSDRGSLAVYGRIGERERFTNSILIRDRLQRDFPNVVAVGYFVVQSQTFDKTVLRYITDSGATSNNPEGVEVWFDAITLPRDRFSALEQFDCILHKNGAYFPKDPRLNDKPNPQRLDVILCPVVQLKPDPDNPGLSKFALIGVAGLGVRSPVSEIEPYAGIFWRYTPNLESLY